MQATRNPSQLLDYEELKLPYLDLYYGFLAERHNIWVNRYVHRQPAPWSEDTAFQQYKFTNSYRELDRGTIYFRRVMAPTFKNNHEALLNTLFYKVFNYIDTQQEIGIINYPNPDWDYVQQRIHDRLVRNERIFTNAHMVNSVRGLAISEDEVKEKWQADNKANRYIKGFKNHFMPKIDEHVHALETCKTLAEAWDIVGYLSPGVGFFTQYEIIVHLIWTPLLERFSFDDWTSPGPGAQTFLNYMIPGLNYDPEINRQVLILLWEEQEFHFNRLGLDLQGPRLHLLNIENAACEASKMSKIKFGLGRPRNHYEGKEPTITTDKSTESYLSLLGDDIHYWSSFVPR